MKGTIVRISVFLSLSDVLSDDEPSVFTTLHRCDEKDAVTVAAQRTICTRSFAKAPEYEVKAQNAKLITYGKRCPATTA
ncbi:hypothetical protein PO124_00290 [Bacillus licheniformis]|nr:hypothetical protein [Bacillus licheniformis]